ncbi:HesA/MoeB/ThiF family protein [Candidatus Pelagibacter sp.]|nr:HesA/MoeB/ThiF family protein [Candidatus Pelagibacter sp.]
MSKNLSTKQIEKYSRQIVLKNVGTIGQKKILNSNVLIVGAGGLGCPVIDYLSRAGVGKIGIIDFDKVDVSNIHRQSIYTLKDVGKYKVEVLKKIITDINPDVKTKIYKNKITKKNAYKILNQFDIIVDGSDNFKTKFLLNQFAYKLKKIFIVGAISRYDGHIFSFNFKKNNEACLKCFYQSEVNEEVLNCETEGILGPVAGIVGNIQANEVLKYILGLKNELRNKILIINLLNLTLRHTKFSKKKNCICGKK